MTARILLSELTGEPLPEPLVLPATSANQKTPAPDTLNVEREHTQASITSIISTEVS